MRFNDIVKFSLENLRHRRLRSWLTIIGIVIGVAAVVGLVSIGQGLQQSIEGQLSGLGGDLIFITPGHSRAMGGFGGGEGSGGFGGGGLISGNLTENDLRAVKAIPAISATSGILNKQAEVKYISETATINVQGADPELQKAFSTVLLASGRYLIVGDNRVAVIGYNVANRLFKKSLNINSIIFVNGVSFRVVGIFQQSGQLAQTDNLVIIPITEARNIFTDLPRNQVSAIIAKTSEGSDINAVTTQIENKLLILHHITADKQDFSITTSQSILQTIGQITTTITLFLGGIAAISLIVGGIGIANTMFMSILERTRQIGILKALGTTNKDVMELFLIESGILGLVGGVIGVVIGTLVSFALSNIRLTGFFGGASGLQTAVTWQLIVFAIAFSMFVGIASGIFPARRAAKLQPVEALRYE